MLEETRNTITVPASFMLRMLASLNHIRAGERLLKILSTTLVCEIAGGLGNHQDLQFCVAVLGVGEKIQGLFKVLSIKVLRNCFFGVRLATRCSCYFLSQNKEQNIFLGVEKYSLQEWSYKWVLCDEKTIGEDWNEL